MKIKILSVTAIALTAVIIFFTVNTFSPQTKKAPDFSVNTIDGQVLNLGTFTGKPVLVTFWATTCSTCIQEMPHLVNLYEELNNEGLEIISIAMYYDPPNRVVELSQQKELPYPVALDIEGKTAQAFGNIKATPTSFLISPNGMIIQKQVGELNIDQLRTEIKQLIENNKTNLS